MTDYTQLANGISAIRVSTTKQGTDGDSPEAQREQIERFAASKNIAVKKIFIFLESASKEQQPMQEAIDYCKNPKNNVKYFIVKSIDRFTRGGAYSYDHLKRQLEKYNVDLIDIYGVINNTKVNTLEHLGVEYNWSVYSPSKKTEILAAEQAKDEMREIMSRMIGAEVRYTQLGYWMRQPPHGYLSEKIETEHGKRCILRPHSNEGIHMKRLFELRAQGTMDDHQIADALNKLGFQTRIELIRSKQDRTKVVSQRGGKKMTAKMVNRYVQNPIYAGVIKEKLTKNKALKARFEGLVSYELFNAANRGKRTIVELAENEIEVVEKAPPVHLTNKGVRNPDFPYKRFVMCPQCRKPLLGSSSRGKLGKYYPAYHCSNHGHYFRVPKHELEGDIIKYVQNITFNTEHLDALLDRVVAIWEKRQESVKKDEAATQKHINELRTQIRVIVDKMKVISSATALKYMEEDLMKLEQEIANLEAPEPELVDINQPNITKIVESVKYYMEHLDELLIHHCNPMNKAAYFKCII